MQVFHVSVTILVEGTSRKFEWHTDLEPTDDAIQISALGAVVSDASVEVYEVYEGGDLKPFELFIAREIRTYASLTGATPDPNVARINELDRSLRNLERTVTDQYAKIAAMLSGRLPETGNPTQAYLPTGATVGAAIREYPTEGMVPPGTKPSVRDRRRARGEEADIADAERTPSEALDSDSMSIVGPSPHSDVFTVGPDGKMVAAPTPRVGNSMRIGTRTRT